MKYFLSSPQKNKTQASQKLSQLESDLLREMIANDDENDKGGIWTNQFLQRVDEKVLLLSVTLTCPFMEKQS